MLNDETPKPHAIPQDVRPQGSMKDVSLKIAAGNRCVICSLSMLTTQLRCESIMLERMMHDHVVHA